MVGKLNEITKLLVISGFLTCGIANANINRFSALENLSDQNLSYFAEKKRQRLVLVNGETLTSSLSDINLQQVSYNLSSIGNMQQMSGSGISFQQWRNTSSNALDENNTVINDSYQNVLTGKFAVDSESSWMASINEGQSKIDSIRVFTGDYSDSKTQSYGVSLAYNKKTGNSNVFAYIGKNWIENKLETLNSNYDGSQTHIGFGANYDTIFHNVKLTPQVNIQKLESSLNSSLNSKDGGNARQTTATVSMSSDYKASEKVDFTASLNYEKDLSVQGQIKTQSGYQEVNSMFPKERVGVALTMMYKPVEKINVVMSFKHFSSNKWQNESFNIGLNYNF